MLGSPLNRHLLGLGVGTEGLLRLTPLAARIGRRDSHPGVKQIVTSFPPPPAPPVAGSGSVILAGRCLRAGARGGGIESVLGEGGWAARVRTVTGTVGVGGSVGARWAGAVATSIGGVNRTLIGLGWAALEEEHGRSAWIRWGEGLADVDVVVGGRMAAPTAEGGTPVA